MRLILSNINCYTHEGCGKNQSRSTRYLPDAENTSRIGLGLSDVGKIHSAYLDIHSAFDLDMHNLPPSTDSNFDDFLCYTTFC